MDDTVSTEEEVVDRANAVTPYCSWSWSISSTMWWPSPVRESAPLPRGGEDTTSDRAEGRRPAGGRAHYAFVPRPYSITQ
jgi:hypothetical protein